MRLINSIRSLSKRSEAPLLIAALGSLALSLIALQFSPIIGRDDALYLELAEQIKRHGWQGSETGFDWPWFSFLIAWLSKATGLSLIHAGHLLVTGMFAALAVFLTRTAQNIDPQAAYWTCLVALSMPAYNTYRDTIIRDPGFWCFLSVSVWALSCSLDRKRAFWLLVAAVGVLGASVFRLEAAFFFGTIVAGFAISQRGKVRPAAALSILLALLLLVAVVAYGVVKLAADQARVAHYLQLVDPINLLANFKESYRTLATTILAHYSRDHAALILFSGYLSSILVKFLELAGPFCLMIFLLRSRYFDARTTALSQYISSAVLLYLGVLMVFFMQHDFMIDRYVTLLHVLLTPLFGILILRWSSARPRAIPWVISISILFALANVVSLSPKRTHYIPAAEWIRTQTKAEQPIYYEDRRISFYAGRGYALAAYHPRPVEELLQGYELLVLEKRANEDPIVRGLEQGTLILEASFANDDGQEVQIIRNGAVR